VHPRNKMFSALTIISASASDSLELQQVEEVNPQTLHGPHGLLAGLWENIYHPRKNQDINQNKIVKFTNIE
jgi:hypothetical protein